MADTGRTGKRLEVMGVYVETTFAGLRGSVDVIALDGKPLTDAENAEAAALVECMRRGWMALHAPGVSADIGIRVGDTGHWYGAPTLAAALERALEAEP